MEELKDLTPAEVYLIQHHRKAKVGQMLKITVSDLLLRNILIYREHEVRKTVQSGYFKTGYLSLNKDHNPDGLRPHEKLFLFLFDDNYDLEIWMPYVAEIISKNTNVKTFHAFIKKLMFENPEVIKSLRMDTRDRSSLRLTAHGKEKKESIDRLIKQMDKELPKFFNSNHAEAMQLVGQLGGHVFLLKKTNLKYISSLDIEFEVDQNTVKAVDHKAAFSNNFKMDQIGDFTRRLNFFTHHFNESSLFDNISSDSSSSGSGHSGGGSFWGSDSLGDSSGCGSSGCGTGCGGGCGGN